MEPPDGNDGTTRWRWWNHHTRPADGNVGITTQNLLTEISARCLRCQWRLRFVCPLKEAGEGGGAGGGRRGIQISIVSRLAIGGRDCCHDGLVGPQLEFPCRDRFNPLCVSIGTDWRRLSVSVSVCLCPSLSLCISLSLSLSLSLWRWSVCLNLILWK